MSTASPTSQLHTSPPLDRSPFEEPSLHRAIAELEAAVAEPSTDFVSGSMAVDVFDRAERLNRLAAVARVDAIAAVERSKVHRLHGHSAAHQMARHLGRLSSAETSRADKIRRMVTDCEQIDGAWRAGELSVDQAAVLGRAFTNPRSRSAFIDAQDWFLKLAAKPFPTFERRVADWVRLHDMDGPEPRPEPAHENRDASLVQDHFSQQWTLKGSSGSLQGSEMRRIFDAYISAENLTDWEAARAIHGDAVCANDLARTPAQRRADALAQIFADAASNRETSVAVDTCHTIVWSQQSFEHAFRRFLGENPEPIDIDQHRCNDLDGHGLDPDMAFADAVISDWRRAVVSAQGITLDLSRKHRFFTGLARLGVQLNHERCFWPGCEVPTTSCQIDHTRPAARGGLTEQANGAPACQKHNRLKERGYSVVRNGDGTFTVTAPTGEILPD